MSNAIARNWQVGATLRDELAAELAYLRWVLQQAGLPTEVRNVTEQRRLNVNRQLAALPTCEHLIEGALVDGVYGLDMFDPPRACLTCSCGQSFTNSLRSSFADRVRPLVDTGGALAPGGRVSIAATMETTNAR